MQCVPDSLLTVPLPTQPRVWVRGYLLPYRSKIFHWVYSTTFSLSKNASSMVCCVQRAVSSQSNSYFSIRATWVPMSRNIVLRYAKYVHAAVQPVLKILHCYWSLSSLTGLSVHRVMFCGTLVKSVFDGFVDSYLICYGTPNKCHAPPCNSLLLQWKH